MNKKQLLAAKVAEMMAMLNKAKTENRAFTADEETVYAALETSKKTLEAEIAAEDLQVQREAELEAQMKALNATAGVVAGKSGNPQVVVGANREAEKPWASFGEQLMAVKSAAAPGGSLDPRLTVKAAAGLNEGIGSDGGFLVQPDFSTELLKRAYDTGILASKVKKVPLSTNANGLKINGIDENSRANGSRWGGIQAFWENEADQHTSTRPKFRQINLNLKKLTGMCYATDELLQDEAALAAVISEGFAEEFGFRIDDAIINGQGAGQPLGILNAKALVTVVKEGTQAAQTININNIVKMWSRLNARSQMNAEWYINQDIIPQLFTLSLTIGNAGVPVYMPSTGISGQPYATLFGRPVIPIEQCNTLGSVGDIILADLSQYVMIDKGAIKADVSVHVRFIYDEQAFKFVYRVDGQPVWQDVLTPFKGSNTVSPFVTLQAR